MSIILPVGKEMLEEMKRLGYLGWKVSDDFPDGVYTFYGCPVVITEYLKEEK